PAGATISFTPPQVAPPANAIVSANVSGAEPGVYPITVTGHDGALQFDQPLALELSQSSPGQPLLLLPTADATGVSGIQTLYWSAAPGAISYDLEVATDAAFSNLVFTVTGTSERGYTPPAALAVNTTHYWRVTANNACGSVTSDTGSFTTTGSQCQVYYSSDVPVTIPVSATGTVSSSMSTDATGTIVDVNVVDLQATHTWINDLDIRLEGPFIDHGGVGGRHPDRPSVLLMPQTCNSEDDLDLNFDDEAAAGPIPCPPTDGGNYQPANPLAGFDGSSGTGDWNLLVTDNFVSDGGALENWGLEICTSPESLILDQDNDSVDDLIDNCTQMANPAQRDTDGDGFGNMCDGDFDNDGFVDFLDLAILRADFLLTGDLHTDLNGDGVVDFDDLGLLRLAFLAAPGPSAIAQ
ncbi:MAG: thrombospondin type 3 repeat-containing protein, partial [Gammaproteobacteria bacterium]|nr:thrombospondin type 3 repeat-containing protein [Gammaproteobacteria bacterium]